MSINEENLTPMDIRDFEVVRPHLRAIVRSRADLEAKKLRIGDLLDGGFPYHLVAEDMVVRVAFLIGDTYGFVSDELLDIWRMAFPAVLQIAIANANTRHPRLWGEIRKGFFLTGKRGTTQDAAAALLLDPARILRLPVQGKHVVMALTSDAVAVTGSEDVEGLLTMAQAAYQYYHDEFFVSPQLYSIEGGRLTPHPLPLSHPAWISLRGTAAVCGSSWSVNQARAINAQPSRKPAIPAIPAMTTPVFGALSDGRYSAFLHGAGDAIHERMVHDDLGCVNECLASYPDLARSVASGYRATVRRLQERNCAYVGTFVVWPKDAGPLLLPKADLISFYDPSKGTVEAIAEWSSVDGVASPAGMWPPVFRAERYPDPAVISEMRSVDA